MELEAKLLVAREIAESLPSRPDRVENMIAEAEAAMVTKAKERHRHLRERPRYVDARDTALGYVELTFAADTEAD